MRFCDCYELWTILIFQVINSNKRNYFCSISNVNSRKKNFLIIFNSTYGLHTFLNSLESHSIKISKISYELFCILFWFSRFKKWKMFFWYFQLKKCTLFQTFWRNSFLNVGNVSVVVDREIVEFRLFCIPTDWAYLVKHKQRMNINGFTYYVWKCKRLSFDVCFS